MSWWEHANCIGVPLHRFYPGGRIDSLACEDVVRRYCLPCPVRRECLADELTRSRIDRHGIRGGVIAPANGKSSKAPRDPFGLLEDGAW